MSDNGIVWEDPPHTNYNRLEPFFKELAKKPGKWAVYPNVTNPPWLRKRALALGFDVEVTSRDVDGQRYVYVRVVK